MLQKLQSDGGMEGLDGGGAGLGGWVDVDGRKRNLLKLTVQTKIGFKHYYSGNFTAA